METKERITQLLDYIQTSEQGEIHIDQEAIHAAYQRDEMEHPLPIKILSILGGVLASIFFIIFLFLTALHDSRSPFLFLGVLLITLVIVINKRIDKLLIDTFSVSFYIMGFVLMAMGLSADDLSSNVVAIIFIGVACCSLFILQNYIIAFITILILNGSILTLIITNEGYADFIHLYIAILSLALTYFFLHEAKIIRLNKAFSKLYKPLRIGLIVSLLSVLVILSRQGELINSSTSTWLCSIVLLPTTIYLIQNTIGKVMGIKSMQHKIGIIVLSTILFSFAALSPGVLAAISITLLSFFVNYKTGLVIGIIAFAYFIVQYYYDLNLTLLTKSISLCAFGIFFGALYLFTRKKSTPNEKI